MSDIGYETTDSNKQPCNTERSKDELRNTREMGLEHVDGHGQVASSHDEPPKMADEGHSSQQPQYDERHPSGSDTKGNGCETQLPLPIGIVQPLSRL